MSLVSRFGPLPGGGCLQLCLFHIKRWRLQTVFNVDDDASYGREWSDVGAAPWPIFRTPCNLATAGDEIHIAGGIYTPDQDEAGHVSPRRPNGHVSACRRLSSRSSVGLRRGPGPAGPSGSAQYLALRDDPERGSCWQRRPHPHDERDLPNDETHDREHPAPGRGHRSGPGHSA